MSEAGAASNIAAAAAARVEYGERLLGHLLRDDPGARRRARDIAAVAFSLEPPHDRIAKTIAHHLEQGLDASPTAISLVLQADTGLKEIGGRNYLVALSEAAPAVLNEADGAAKIDRAIATLRTLGYTSECEVRATPYAWVEPEAIPPRKFLFASRHAVSGHASATGAVGGTGKSSLIMTEALAHCTQRNLLNDAPLFRGKAWVLGLEDPLEEHQRRVSAAALLHHIRADEIEGRLFLDTADQGFVIARDTRDGLFIAEPIVDGIIARIREHGITYLAVDPFVACHSCSENDNGAIDTVARLWVRIARETGCAVDLSHHLRKSNGSEPSADDFRGASALIPAVRSARLLVTMSKEEADRFDVEEPFRFLRVIDAKKNMGPRSNKAVWRELVAMDLRNGDPSDHVAAVAAWQPVDATQDMNTDEIEAVKAKIRTGRWRESDKSTDWVGNAVADALGLDLRDKSVRAQVRTVVTLWLRRGTLVVVDGMDSKSMPRKFVEVAE